MNLVTGLLTEVYEDKQIHWKADSRPIRFQYSRSHTILVDSNYYLLTGLWLVQGNKKPDLFVWPKLLKALHKSEGLVFPG